MFSEGGAATPPAARRAYRVAGSCALLVYKWGRRGLRGYLGEEHQFDHAALPGRHRVQAPFADGGMAVNGAEYRKVNPPVLDDPPRYSFVRLSSSAAASFVWSATFLTHCFS